MNLSLLVPPVLLSPSSKSGNELAVELWHRNNESVYVYNPMAPEVLAGIMD